MNLKKYVQITKKRKTVFGSCSFKTRENEVLIQTLVASCLRGALPPVDLRAVCLVRAMFCWEICECLLVRKIVRLEKTFSETSRKYTTRVVRVKYR